MPTNVIRTTMASAAALGAVALAPLAAQGAVAPATTTSTGPTAAPAPATTAAPATATRPTLTKHERKLRIEHRRRVRRKGEVARALRVATRQQGDPYRYGATGPNAFDCSGLTLYSFRAAGLHLPRTAAAQAGAVRHIPRSQLKPGDLIFFTSGGHVYHVGIYDGMSHGRRIVLHAPYPGEGVRKEAIWTNGWFAGTERLA